MGSEFSVGHIREYDAELGKITDEDKEYARDIIEDLGKASGDFNERMMLLATWLRKVRYEAVIADRKKRG